MANKVYLVSRHTSHGGLNSIDEQILNETTGKNVLVLNLANLDKTKSASRQEFFYNYFTKLGANNLDFISEITPYSNARQLFEKIDLLYLPGGDTKTLMTNIKTKKLEPLINSFNGIIEGNNAGAYVLCSEYLNIKNNDPEIVPMMNLVNFCIKTHYTPNFDSLLQKLSNERTIYALENESSIIYKNNITFTGTIWKFCDGHKDRVN